MKRIGILTAGGDTPALNATVHGAIVRANQLGIEVYGLIKGFNSLFNPRVPHLHLNPLSQPIPELDPTVGGTILGASRDYINPDDKRSHGEIPTFSESPKAKRIEYRPPDPACNPYLAFAALLLAGLDGVLNKVEPGEPLDKNIYELPPEELKKVPSVPGSLGEALDCLEKDHEFLLKGDVFTMDFLDTWIAAKRKEHDALRLRPHPYEFFLYYDV